MATSTDYDAPRTIAADDSLDEFPARRGTPDMTVNDIDGGDPTTTLDSLDADLLDEDFTVPVIPMRTDEFRCGRCFLVWHRSQQAVAGMGKALCQDCA